MFLPLLLLSLVSFARTNLFLSELKFTTSDDVFVLQLQDDKGGATAQQVSFNLATGKLTLEEGGEIETTDRTETLPSTFVRGVETKTDFQLDDPQSLTFQMTVQYGDLSAEVVFGNEAAYTHWASPTQETLYVLYTNDAGETIAETRSACGSSSVNMGVLDHTFCKEPRDGPFTKVDDDLGLAALPAGQDCKSILYIAYNKLGINILGFGGGIRLPQGKAKPLMWIGLSPQKDASGAIQNQNAITVANVNQQKTTIRERVYEWQQEQLDVVVNGEPQKKTECPKCKKCEKCETCEVCEPCDCSNASKDTTPDKDKDNKKDTSEETPAPDWDDQEGSDQDDSIEETQPTPKETTPTKDVANRREVIVQFEGELTKDDIKQAVAETLSIKASYVVVGSVDGTTATFTFADSVKPADVAAHIQSFLTVVNQPGGSDLPFTQAAIVQPPAAPATPSAPTPSGEVKVDTASVPGGIWVALSCVVLGFLCCVGVEVTPKGPV
eukprot:TRINITY_DN57278_c0_g1_i1.p1 TRINITY_DN57278_c0_g1~~TRINITY_DN57278_c0_g1_i1.p1  ORF type:complete len:496 (-),score=52.91 TRINITY_DN57278_c0_g1_i1:1556-3043(-)